MGMYLCSFYFARYLDKPDFDPNENYIGFTFAAVKDGAQWHYISEDPSIQKTFRTRTYRNGQPYLSARIQPGYTIMKKSSELVKYGAPSKIRFHEALVQDFFGLTADEMIQRGWY